MSIVDRTRYLSFSPTTGYYMPKLEEYEDVEVLIHNTAPPEYDERTLENDKATLAIYGGITDIEEEGELETPDIPNAHMPDASTVVGNNGS